MTAAPRIQGMFVPNIVPLDSRGQINENELRRYANWLIEKGVHGLYPNGSTGEFTRFTPEERRRTVAILVDEVKGRVPILAGAAEASVRETIEACEYYHGLGVRAVAIVSPFYYRLGPDAVYAYFAEIARNSPIDITLYNIPLFASPIDVATIERLAAEFPRVAAIKDSSGDIAHMMRMIAAVRPKRPDFCFLTGWDSSIVPMLLIGCDGGTNATSGVVPELSRKLFDLTRAGNISEAIELQYRVLTIFDHMLGSLDFPAGFREGVALRGFQLGSSRQPLGDAAIAKTNALRTNLSKLLTQEGLSPCEKV